MTKALHIAAMPFTTLALLFGLIAIALVGLGDLLAARAGK